MPDDPILPQTSAIFGTAIFGRMVLGELLDATGGLPKTSEDGVVKPNPWTARTPMTTTWTPR